MKFLTVMAAAALAAAADGAEMKVRAVQLDLARQMETVPFVKRYLSFAKESGFNTVQLYLEGRIRTKSFPWRAASETYTPEQMKEIVAEAQRVGIDLIPVVSVLGHAENFVNCPELSEFCEETRAGRGRFSVETKKHTFCHSLPGTRAFLEKYIAELLEIFPGKNFHVGLDESFNTGFCPECAAKMKTIGLGGLYFEVIDWARDFLAKRGRRMWMWGDFFEYFPEKAPDLPRDVVICDWGYESDVSRNRGQRGCFGDRFRNDWVRTFRSLGVETIACPGHVTRAMTRFCDYADTAGASGCLVSLWEMSTFFHGRVFIVARAAGKRWSKGIDTLGFDEAKAVAVAELCPTLNGTERMAVLTLAGYSKGGVARNLAVATLMPRIKGEVSPDPFCEEAIVDDLVTSARIGAVSEALAAAEYAESGLYRRPAAIRSAKAKVRALQSEIEALRKRRAAQEQAWRPGCRPNELLKPLDLLAKRSAKLLAVEEKEAADDEWQLEIDLSLPDYHGLPNWTVEGLFDGKWRKLCDGAWKPESAEWCYFGREVKFTAEKAPSALRVSYHGYNDGGVTYLAVANRRAGRFVPAAVSSVNGRVRDVCNMLEDTVDAAWFGNPDCRSYMLDPTGADEVSSAVVTLKPEFP
ncbi:MAG: family 20 glycosylhydrolase [Kiritimatiellae bacterium]|nr:family 20 glycosylhydrolase [Kiritimatiellia bacterium]